MNLLQVRVKVSSKDQHQQLFKFFQRWNLPPKYILRIERLEEVDTHKFVFDVYITRNQLDALISAGFSTEVVVDLADIPDPRSYVSKTNRFKEKLEVLRKQKKGV